MVRWRIRVTGIVQGVGFRPFVFNLAQRCKLSGWVLNDGDGVQLEVEGAADAVAAFTRALREEAPPLAVIADVSGKPCPVRGDREFQIRPSVAAATPNTALIAPDVATCPACQRELGDADNRRYQYPFTNCTNCGPRYTIIRDIPYDRPQTTMAKFTMCPACQAEYDNPADRRFHAQPNACPVCGPSCTLLDQQGRMVTGDPMAKTRELIGHGAIVAIKGIGGYHLACDAHDAAAVNRLRQRKHREAKPLAVMFGSLAAACEQCEVTAAEAELLTGPVRPIVLAAKLPTYNLAANVAPDNAYLGVMLPYAPMHWLLLAPSNVWVMTSANVSEDPIVYQDDAAQAKLAAIADYILTHNREIYRRADDSVVRMFNARPYTIRRSRGLAPSPISLSRCQPPVLACGGQLKNTFCLTRGNLAFLSPHIGDLASLTTYQYYCDTIDHFQRLFAVAPQVVAYDLHPDYLATKHALALDLPKVGVQHHHAHIAAVLAEHGVYDQVIGVAFDGTGYGTDGKLWGGEFLVADCRDFYRAGHCRYLPLPGGEQAVRQPWRLAVWLLYQLYGTSFTRLPLALVRNLPPTWKLVIQAAAQGLNAPLSSGAGRLFDAAAALLGLRSSIDYEGQAAIELEQAAIGLQGHVLPYKINAMTPLILDMLPALATMCEQSARGVAPGQLAADFHATMAQAVADMVQRISCQTGLKTVALSGGVWQNITLLEQTVELLTAAGFNVLLPCQVPANDGGIAIGQAVIAGERSRE